MMGAFLGITGMVLLGFAFGLPIGRWSVPRPAPAAPTDGPTIIPGCWYRLPGAHDVQVASIRDGVVFYGVREGEKSIIWELPLAAFAQHAALLTPKTAKPTLAAPPAPEVTP